MSFFHEPFDATPFQRRVYRQTTPARQSQSWTYEAVAALAAAGAWDEGGQEPAVWLRRRFTVLGFASTVCSPLAGQLVLSGAAPGASQAGGAAPAAGLLTFSGVTPTLSEAVSFAPVAGALLISGATPGLSQAGLTGPGAGAWTTIGPPADGWTVIPPPT